MKMTWKTRGKAPDYRFTLANERTFLAWIRTALAFMAAAIGIDQLTSNLASPEFRGIVVIWLSLFAAILAGYAWRRWKLNEMAMRHDEALTYPPLMLWLSGGLTLTMITIGTALFLL